MADVTIKYKGANIATMDASGTKTLNTSGKYCEGDVQVVYADPEKPTQSKTVTPTASGFTVSPDSGKVLSSVVVNGDADLIASNIRSGKNIFGVDGTLVEGITPSGNKALTPSTTAQTNVDVTNYATASVAAITKELLASLDADFAAENIKKDVDLFGLLGTLDGGGGGGDPIDGYETHYGTFTPASVVTTYTIDVEVDTNNYIASSTRPGFVFLCFRDPNLIDSDIEGLVSITVARVKKGALTMATSGSFMNAYGLLNTGITDSNLSSSYTRDTLSFTIKDKKISSETYFWILLRKWVG